MITEYYKSTKDYLSTINARPIQPYYKKYMSSCDSNPAFYGTESYEESVQFAEKGDLKNFALIKQEKTKIKSKECEFVLTVKNLLQPAGGVPVVPLALKGVPNCFISRVKAKIPVKVLNLGLYVGVNHSTASDSIVKYSSYIASFISILEMNNIRINLFYCKQSYSKSVKADSQILVVKLKKAEQPLNLLKLSYWLINPSVNRRQGFRWIETLPGGFKDGCYGISARKENFIKPNLKFDMRYIFLNDLIKKAYSYEGTIKYLQGIILK